jgi:hypothetical protein
MEILRDPAWQTLIAILALLLSAYVAREKISKLYFSVLTRLQGILSRLGNASPAIMHGTSSLLNVLFLSLLAIFILIAPIFLYKEIIQHQVLFIDPFIIDNKSMIYGLIAIVWCMSIMTFRHKLIIDELRSQMDYLDRVPDIRKLKDKYNKQLFDSAARQWSDFRTELVNKHDDSPFAIDLAACSPLRVQDETLIMSCPNKVIHKRMVLKAPSSSMGYNDEYEAKKRDKASIEEMVKERFRVRRISYTLENRITT